VIGSPSPGLTAGARPMEPREREQRTMIVALPEYRIRKNRRGSWPWRETAGRSLAEIGGMPENPAPHSSESECLQAQVAQALTGEEPALSDLVDRLTPVVQMRVGRCLLRQRPPGMKRNVRQEVEDLTQEAFLMLFADDGKVLRSWNPQQGLSLPSFVGLVAGIMWGAKSGVQFSLSLIALKALPVLILGGFTSVPGAIVGGLIIGVGEKIAEIYWGPLVGGAIENWFAYMLALAFLLFRPQGLFGERIIERV